MRIIAGSKKGHREAARSLVDIQDPLDAEVGARFAEAGPIA